MLTPYVDWIPPTTCACGCGKCVTPGRRFQPGHNRRVLGSAGPHYTIDPDTGCWLWVRAKSSGYGKMRLSGGEWGYAHRGFYEQHVGPIPVGFEIDHICRNRACVNPDHLRIATGAQNAQNQGARRDVARGVTWDRGRWVAGVKIDGQRHYLGRYKTEVEAAAAASAFRAEHMPFSDDARGVL